MSGEKRGEAARGSRDRVEEDEKKRVREERKKKVLSRATTKDFLNLV